MAVELLFLFSCLVILLQVFLSRRNNIFRRLRIPGPEPKLLVGNLLDIFGEGKSIAAQLQKWTKEFGPIYGFYEGSRPVLVVSDPDFIQEMLVKKFNHFYARREFPIQPHPAKGGDRVHMFMARGEQWKRLRVISNPTFTSAKLKQILPKVHDRIGETLQVLERKSKEKDGFDIYGTYQGLTLDVIASVAFAYETSAQKNPDNDLLNTCRSLFRSPPSAVAFSAMVFSPIRRLFYYYLRLRSFVIKSSIDKLREHIGKMVQMKRQQKAAGEPGGVDFIQLLLDAEADSSEVSADFRNGASKVAIKEMDVKKKLTSGEIVSQSNLFLLAGYETTSTSLAFISYLLATHPEVQSKLLEEIDERISTDDDIKYETVQKMKYLDSVIQEALRLYPVASGAVNRQCMEPCTINGVFIPKNMEILVDVWSLHYNEELWGPDAKEFRPERFMSNSLPHPMAYIPFGAGPRICIGMRFAVLEMKMALCAILKRYQLEECSQTQKPLQLRSTTLTVTPKDVVHIKLKERV